jgi:hypothetical protein
MKFIITSMFGALEEIRSGVSHKGIDLAMSKGTPLRSITKGVVERVTEYRGNIGNGVIIKTEDGARHIFGHMDAVSVTPGQHVGPGTFLGTSGNSGYSTGPHLHFGIWKDGTFQDPTSVIEKVDAMAGTLFKGQGIITQWAGSTLRDKVKENAADAILGFLDALRDITLDVEYSVCLIGSGILIILRAVGFKHAWLRPGVLMTLHVLIRFLLGGFTA